MNCKKEEDCLVGNTKQTFRDVHTMYAFDVDFIFVKLMRKKERKHWHFRKCLVILKLFQRFNKNKVQRISMSRDTVQGLF